MARSFCVIVYKARLLEARTVESLLKDLLIKGHSTFDLSIKDTFCSVNGTKLQNIFSRIEI